MCFMYRPSLGKGSEQLIVTLCTQSIYPSVQKQIIGTLFEAHLVYLLKKENIIISQLPKQFIFSI